MTSRIRALLVIFSILLLAQAAVMHLPAPHYDYAYEGASTVAGLSAETSSPVTMNTATINTVRAGERLNRLGDEIVVCGQLFHTGTPVVLWTDPGGYDGYRTECRFGPLAQAPWDAARLLNKDLKTPNRYGLRKDNLTPEQLDQVRGGGWDLELLQQTVDQFVLHYDQSGTSRRCFQVLHDQRCLSIHFMLDLDGTIYQTLDLKERAWHATISNTRSIGVEIANIGAFPISTEASTEANHDEQGRLAQWYTHDASGTRVVLPESDEKNGIHTLNFVARPARNEAVTATIQGNVLTQYDYTPQQYDALIRLTATLCKVFPKISCDYPKDAQGKLIPQKLSEAELKSYHGLLGHYHVQANKVDPGPAMDWERIIIGARALGQ